MSAYPSAFSTVPRLPASTGNPVDEFATGRRTGDVSGLIGRQFRETREAQDASLNSVQQAINNLILRSQSAAAQYNKVRGNENPNIAKIRANIQSVLDNPDVLSSSDIGNLQSIAESKRLNLLDNERNSINEDAAARGISSSGIRVDNLGNAANRAQSDIIQQILGITANAKQLRADNLARAQGLSTGLETAVLNNETDLDKFFIGNDEARANAISSLLAGIEYNAPDYSGLAGLGLGQYNADQQNDIIRNQLQQEMIRQYLGTYGGGLPLNRIGTGQFGNPIYGPPDFNEFLREFTTGRR